MRWLKASDHRGDGPGRASWQVRCAVAPGRGIVTTGTPVRSVG